MARRLSAVPSTPEAVPSRQQASLLTADSFLIIVAEKVRQEQLRRLGSQLLGTLLLSTLFFLLVFNSVRTVNSAVAVAALRSEITESDFEFETGAEFRKTFHSIGSVIDFWQWAKGPLLGTLSSATLYNVSVNGTAITAAKEPTYLGFNNKLVGAVRFRQLRVQSGGCQSSDMMTDTRQPCYGHYDTCLGWAVGCKDYESKESFRAYSYSDSGGAFSSWIGHTFGTNQFLGDFVTYPRGGFVVDVSAGELIDGSYQTKLQQMLSNGFIDAATRAVFVTIYTYNHATSTVSTLQMLVEFSPSGRVVPSASGDSWYLPDKSEVTSVKSWFLLGSVIFPLCLLFEASGHLKMLCTKMKTRLYRERVRKRLWPHALVMHRKEQVYQCLQAVSSNPAQEWGSGHGFAIYWWRQLKWDTPETPSFHHCNFWHQQEPWQGNTDSDYSATRQVLEQLHLDLRMIDQIALPSMQVNHGVLLYVVAALDRLGWMTVQCTNSSMRVPRVAFDSWYHALELHPNNAHEVALSLAEKLQKELQSYAAHKGTSLDSAATELSRHVARVLSWNQIEVLDEFVRVSNFSGWLKCAIALLSTAIDLESTSMNYQLHRVLFSLNNHFSNVSVGKGGLLKRKLRAPTDAQLFPDDNITGILLNPPVFDFFTILALFKDLVLLVWFGFVADSIRIGQGVSVSATSNAFPTDLQSMHSNAWTITKILTPLSCMLVMFQMLEFFKWIPRMMHLYLMFYKAASSLWSFIVFLGVLFLATGMFAHFAFALSLESFGSIWKACTKQVSMMMGDISYEDLVDANRGLGLVFFLIFCIVMILVFVNVFVAIISNAYDQAKREVEKMISPGQFQQGVLTSLLTMVIQGCSCIQLSIWQTGSEAPFSCCDTIYYFCRNFLWGHLSTYTKVSHGNRPHLLRRLFCLGMPESNAGHLELETSQLCWIWHVELSESVAMHAHLRGCQSLVDRRDVYRVLLNGPIQIQALDPMPVMSASDPMPVLRGEPSTIEPYHRKYTKLFTVQQMESHFRRIQEIETNDRNKGPIARLEERCNEARKLDLYDKELLVLKNILRHLQAQDRISANAVQSDEDCQFFSTLVLRMVWVREAELTAVVEQWESQCWVMGRSIQRLYSALKDSNLGDTIAGLYSRSQYQTEVIHSDVLLSAKVAPSAADMGVDYARWNQVFNDTATSSQAGEVMGIGVPPVDENQLMNLKAQNLQLRQLLELHRTEQGLAQIDEVALTDFSPRSPKGS